MALPAAAAPTPADRAFDRTSQRFLEALWQRDPEAAIAAGRYEGAARLPAPDAAARARELAFITGWQKALAAIDARQLSTDQRTDLVLLQDKLAADRWQLTELREWAWNPSGYNIAGAIDLILQTEFAPRPQRLRLLQRRLAQVPAYYAAARNSLDHPTREHTQLAISQAAGVLEVLDAVATAGRDAGLTPAEQHRLGQAVDRAKTAVDDYRAFLVALDARQAADGSARPFRLGRALYGARFGLEIRNGRSAEQTYAQALAAREALLTRMDGLADGLWPATLGTAPKPADRLQKIGQVIARLSERHVRREDFLAEIRRQIPLLQDWVVQHDLLTVDPSKPLVVRETPLWERGVAGAGIEAPGPYRPQDRTYYNVTPLDDLSAERAESSLREYNHWMLQILNIHEAIPGHYTQLIHANRSPSRVRTLFGNGAMVEGWAVYGERMMLESGWGDNAPEMWLMWCKWNLRSVTNTVLDYSVHVLGMDEAEALDLLTRQAFQTEQEAREKWRRVQLTSVQLTSYFAGYSAISDLREERRQALGQDFDLKAFHEQFLGYGNAPVPLIRELMMGSAARPPALRP